MTVEQWGDLLAFTCAPAANMFWLLYWTTAPWWRSWSGRAVITSKLGLAVLVDAAVLYRLLGRDYYGHEVIVLVAFGLITVGTWLYLFAFAHEQYRRRNDPPVEP